MIGLSLGANMIYLNTEIFDIPLKVNLKPGIYRLGMESGTGKSLLYSAIKTRPDRFDFKADAITYWDIKLEKDIQYLRNSNLNIILFDRYDKYSNNTKCWDIILAQKDKAAILLDLKLIRNPLPFKCERAYISYTDKGVTLSNDLSW